MESPAIAAQPHHRRPTYRDIVYSLPGSGLQPKPKAVALRSPRLCGECAVNENGSISPLEPRTLARLRDASLASVRRRREHHRAERERTEKVLSERDAVMQQWALKLDKWAEEHQNLEMELRLLIKLMELRSSSTMRSQSLSLREKEREMNMEV